MTPVMAGMNNSGRKDSKNPAPSSIILTGMILTDKHMMSRIKPMMLPGMGR